jgi:hypothetical protein
MKTISQFDASVTSVSLGLVVRFENLGILSAYGQTRETEDLFVRRVEGGFLAEARTPDGEAFLQLV